MGLDVAGVWDIECAEWTRFRVGELLGRDGRRVVSWDEDTFFRELTSRSGVWYAHAGGAYDALWLLDQASRRGMEWSARLRGSGVLSARVGSVEVRDSMALVPMSLARAAPMGGGAKLDLALACECGEDCGGYCALSRELAPAERAQVEDYLHADCTALLGVLDALERTCEARGVSLGLTVGGSAWATARAWLALPACTHDLGRYKRVRQGYYGGRVEVFRREAPDGHRYDIHSSYPAALSRVSLPVGELASLTGSAASSAFAGGREGIYGARVWVPPWLDVPPLPVRVGERLLYPIGPIEGAWTGLELRRAVELGAKVERVGWAYAWPDARPVLAPFAERVWSYRAAAAELGTDEGKAWSGWWKFLANSLTGKLGQRPEKYALRFAPSIGGEAPELEEHGFDVVRCTREGVYYRKRTERVDTCAHVEWSAYLTAEARTELGAQLRASSRPLYCDTDSVYSRARQTRRVGDELGEWGYEGALRDWQALAPKVYSYTDPATGRRRVKAKGLSGIDGEGFDALAAGGRWTVSRGAKGLRSALASQGGGLFARKLLTRGLLPRPGWVGGRELDADGVTTRAVSLARWHDAQRAK